MFCEIYEQKIAISREIYYHIFDPVYVWEVEIELSVADLPDHRAKREINVLLIFHLSIVKSFLFRFVCSVQQAVHLNLNLTIVTSILDVVPLSYLFLIILFY